MTLGQLKSKRDEFWDTQPNYSGRREIWQAVKAALECEDKETAQLIVDAVDVTLPNGNLSLVYDELGNKYEIPAFCLCDPDNLVPEGGDGVAAAAAGAPAGGGGGAAGGRTPGELAPTGAAAGATKEKQAIEAKKQAQSIEAKKMTVKLRLNPGPELKWSGPASTTIAELKSFVQEEQGVAPGRQRLIFGGMILTNDQNLTTARLVDDGVVQVIVKAEE